MNDGQTAAAILLQDARGLLREQAKRIEALEAALHKIDDTSIDHVAVRIVRNALLQCSPDTKTSTRVTGATDIVDEAACLIWSELCPGTVMGDEDRPYYEAAAKAVLAIAVEKCAKVCENLRHVDYPSETSEWSSGTFDCAQAIRELVRSAGPSDKGHLSCPDLSTLT